MRLVYRLNFIASDNFTLFINMYADNINHCFL